MFTNEGRMWKKYPDPLIKLQSSRISFDFSTKWFNYGEEIWNAPDVYPIFSGLSLSLLLRFSPFYPSFLLHWEFSIKITIGLYLLFLKKIFFNLTEKWNWKNKVIKTVLTGPASEMPREIFSFSNLLQTKILPWSFSTNLS